MTVNIVRYFLSPDAIATLSGKSTQFSRAAWVLKGCANCADPSHSRTNPVQVRSAPYAYIAPISPEEKQDAIGLSATSGGELWASSNPYNAGAVLGSVVSGEHGLVRIDARPFIGFEFVGFGGETGPMFSGYAGGIFYGPTVLYRVAGESEEVHGVFKEKKEYTLDLKVAGDDVPCSGYVTAEPAMKYYLPGTRLELVANALPGYAFAGWAGDAWGSGSWIGAQVPVSLLFLYPTIYVKMNADYTVSAIFKEEAPGASGSFDPETCEYCLHLGTPQNGSLQNDVALSAATGFTTFSPNRFGCEGWMHKKIKAIGAAWAATHNYGFEVGRISKEHGGAAEGHSHRNGLDVDVRYLHKDDSGEHEGGQFSFGVNTGDTPGPGTFDKEATEDLINLFLGQGATMVIVDNRSGITGSTISYDPDNNDRVHYHHFHVRFPDPDGSNN